MTRYYRTPVHQGVTRQFAYAIRRVTECFETVHRDREKLDMRQKAYLVSEAMAHLEFAQRLGQILKSSCFRRDEVEEILLSLKKIRKKHRSTLEKIWALPRALRDPAFAHWPSFSPISWLNSLIHEVQQPGQPLPTKSPKVLEVTHDHKKLGLRFVAPARLRATQIHEVLNSLPPSARSRMKVLLEENKNKPLKMRGEYPIAEAEAHETHEWELWYRRVNAKLPKVSIRGRRYRLIENGHPTGRYVQLWETAGEMSPSYGLGNKDRWRGRKDRPIAA